MNASPLVSTLNALLTPGKGILAADESFPTLEKRFQPLGIRSTEETRREYRQMLLTTPDLGRFISGVILFDETIRQRIGNDLPVPEVLEKQGIVPGIKVDLGTHDLPGFPGEKFTQGLDGLRKRLVEYYGLGARFTKWRAVISIGKKTPSRTCIDTNAGALALFAALSQEAGMVPIVEPEVLMEGDHSLRRCEEVTAVTLEAVFEALLRHRVILEGMLLKTGMVLSGKEAQEPAGAEEIAETTLRCFLRCVPAAIPGIVFLSGGQKAVAATENLRAICQLGGAPWKLSFSFGRALQAPALEIWKGSYENVQAAQEALFHRAECNAAALAGKRCNEEEPTLTALSR